AVSWSASAQVVTSSNRSRWYRLERPVTGRGLQPLESTRLCTARGPTRAADFDLGAHVEKTEARKAAALVPSSRCRLTLAMPAIHQGMERAYCQRLLPSGYQVSRLDARSASIAGQARRAGFRAVNWPT